MGLPLLLPLLLTTAPPRDLVMEEQAEARTLWAFRFAEVPPPVVGDAAARGRLTWIGDDALDLARIADDGLERAPVLPEGGGRVVLDLGSDQDLECVATYSRGTGQAYTLYVGLEGVDPLPARPVDPTRVGWTRVGRVDVDGSGQVGVQVRGLGRARHVLLDVELGALHELDVVTADDVDLAPIPVPPPRQFSIGFGDTRAHFVLESTPDLARPVVDHLVPVVAAWYPRIVALLPSEGFEAPKELTIVFLPGDQWGAGAGVPAYASGNAIACNADWYARNLEGEAVGCIVHELVHVAQRLDLAGKRPAPSWLSEGIADYIRWFLFEPETGGAEMGAAHLPQARHDASDRITANFLRWVIAQHGEEVLPALNAAARHGRYRDELWVELTGSTVEELEAGWRADLEGR